MDAVLEHVQCLLLALHRQVDLLLLGLLQLSLQKMSRLLILFGLLFASESAQLDSKVVGQLVVPLFQRQLLPSTVIL